MIRKLLIPAAMMMTLALAGTALAGSSHGTIVKLRNTKLGPVLVGRTGHLLYVFAPDKRNKDTCVKKSGCTQVWPPLTTSAKPVGQGGVKGSLLGTIKLPNGKQQVTYAGHPLYNWISDPGGGSTSYVGVNSTGGRWYAINAAGHVLK